MKKANFPLRLFVVGSSLLLSSGLVSVAAEGDGGPPVVIAPPAPTVPAPEKLPYGVDDVVKLSRAQISEDIILNYVQNSGTIYNLNPNDIVTLRNQGVSDRVVNAMLDQRKRLTDPTAPAQNQLAAQPAPAAPAAPTAPPDASAAQTQPAPVYAEAPLQPPSSSVYVVPYAPSYPYYYPYYWGAPAVTFGFGWYGGHYYGHGYYGHGHYGGHWGGYHGGYHGGHH